MLSLRVGVKMRAADGYTNRCPYSRPYSFSHALTDCTPNLSSHKRSYYRPRLLFASAVLHGV